MRNINEINNENRTYYFFNNMINIQYFDSNLLKTDKKLYKNIHTYYNGYITIKNISDYECIHSVNLLYLIIRKVDGYIEESNGNNTKFLLIQIKTRSTDKMHKDFGWD